MGINWIRAFGCWIMFLTISYIGPEIWWEEETKNANIEECRARTLGARQSKRLMMRRWYGSRLHLLAPR